MQYGRVVFIYFLAIILFTLTIQNESLSLSKRFNYTPLLGKNFWQTRLEQFRSKDLSRLTRAYVLGIRRGVKREWKDWHTNLGLQHILTPSGIHLSSILFLTLPLKKLKKYVFLKFLFSVSSLIIYFYVPGFFALKRIIIFRTLRYWKFNNHSIITTFFLTFLIDYIFGGYEKNSLSFCYSFLFFGTLLSSPTGMFSKTFSMWGAFLLSGLFNGQDWNAITLLANPIITAVFTLVFPIIFITFIIGWIPLCESIVYIFFKTIENVAIIQSKIPSLQTDYLLLGLMLTFLLHRSIRVKKFVLGGYLLFYSPLVNIQKQKNLNVWNWKYLRNLERPNLIIEKKYFKDGIELQYRSGRICKIHIRDGYYIPKCTK